MSDVFDVFESVPYTYLVLSRGGVRGNSVEEEYDAEGVFKLRSGMNVANDQETKSGDATLHIRPDEEFTPKVGNGIYIGGNTYEIVGLTDGRNFETGQTEHYRVTLQSTSFVYEEES